VGVKETEGFIVGTSVGLAVGTAVGESVAATNKLLNPPPPIHSPMRVNAKTILRMAFVVFYYALL
jgi:hypothetical protein